MKIINKTKRFVKKNWKPIVTGIGIGSACCGFYLFGVKKGFDKFGENISKALDINFRNEYDVGTINGKLRDLIVDECPDCLTNAGYGLDDNVNLAVIIQKSE